MPELRAISGVGVKGPACFLLQMQGRNLLLDLGRGPDGGRLPDLSGLPPLDAILISHGHVDHTGGLDLWSDLGAPPLFATRPTIALTEWPALQQATPLEGLDMICGLPLATGPAGHAPGAVWMRIGGPEGLLYTGDISAESLMFHHAAPPPAAALVLDASYGQADEPLADQIAEIVALADGPMLFPCPADGRGLELALVFLRHGFPVSICDAHRRVARTLQDHLELLTDDGRNALALLDNAYPLEATSSLSGIMIAAGPNAERGTSGALAARIEAEGGAGIVFTGHVATGSPAQALVASGRAQLRRWNVHPTFGGAAGLVAACVPRTMLAAFCDDAMLAGLRAGSGWPIAPGDRMVW